LPAPTLESTPVANEKLAALLRKDLDFGSADSAYASHGIHPFAAKFPPQLPRLFIEELTKSGDSVLDPMAGSGTTIVEALMLRREAFGFDIDPLAVRLCRVKTNWLDTRELQTVGLTIIESAHRTRRAEASLNRELKGRFDQVTRDFLDYWFLKETQLELLSLVLSIEKTAEPLVRDFFELVLSSTIIAKTGGVSLARDLAHSRPHRDLKKKPRNAITEFQLRLGKVLKKFQTLPQRVKRVFVAERDAKDVPIPSNSIDLIVTSPPYANAIDYMRAHKFSLVWFGHSICALSHLRSRYIGSERVNAICSGDLADDVEKAILKLEGIDKSKGKVLRKYLVEMTQVLSEMHRVLKPGKPAVVVVGPSTMRGMEILTHKYLAEIGKAVGFQVAGVQRRSIDRDRRMLPVSFGRNAKSIIEQRMHEEFVVGLVKNSQGEASY
jgi:DNA modification methylase